MRGSSLSGARGWAQQRRGRAVLLWLAEGLEARVACGVPEGVVELRRRWRPTAHAAVATAAAD